MMKRAIADSLGALSAAYLAACAAIYLHSAAPGGGPPEGDGLDRLLFGEKTTIVERLLEAEGERIEGGGTMRPAFTTDSVGWELTEGLDQAEKATLLGEREGERQALLAWVRAGASRDEYESDDFWLPVNAALPPITPKYIKSTSGPVCQIRIRTLITDRCVTCHSEGGRHDTARFIPFENYEDLALRLKPEVHRSGGFWRLVPLVGLPSVALLSGVIFWRSSQSRRVRVTVSAMTFGAITLMVLCWLFGRPGTWHSLAFACCVLVGTLAMLSQTGVAILELFTDPHVVSTATLPHQSITGNPAESCFDIVSLRKPSSRDG